MGYKCDIGKYDVGDQKMLLCLAIPQTRQFYTLQTSTSTPPPPLGMLVAALLHNKPVFCGKARLMI